ncbi:MAG: hypothetical protein LBT84_03885 [Spirochaetia bacterium]|nr:hypothetical protein [Spirochaetia bacterium]
MNNEKTPKRGRVLGLITAISFFAVPLCVAAAVLYGVLTNSSFYTGVLKKAGLLSTFIETRNRQLDAKITNDIEHELHLESAKYDFEQKRGNYEARKSDFDRLNKTEEYNKLKQERDEMSDLSWKNVSHLFNSKDEFGEYRKEELKRLDSQISGIKKYRSENKKLIGKADDLLDDAEDELDEARSEFEKKEKKAQKMAGSEKNTASGRIIADIELITPELTEVLNDKLIDGSIKNEIDEFISFLTSRDEQLKNGSVFYESAEAGNNSAGIGELKILLPEFYLSLIVDDNSLGINRKRHLLSEVFTGIIQNKKGLRSKNELINIFRFSDTGMAEWFTRWYLKDKGLSIRNGRIYMNPVVLSGSSAYKLDDVMRVASMRSLFKAALPASAGAFLLLMLIYPAPFKKKMRRIRAVLLFPSLFIVAACAAVIVLALSGALPHLLKNINVYAAAYLINVMPAASMLLFLPLAGIFSAMAIAGIIIGKIVKK